MDDFERGTGQAPFLLASCLTNLLGGAWRFSLLVGVTVATERHYGGPAATEKKIRDQITDINNKFNNSKVFNGLFEFYVDQYYSFSTNVNAECTKAHRGHAYRIVYDGFPAQDGGWDGTYQAIYHSWHEMDKNGPGPFCANATDGLAHEFGHARGAIDLYKMAVEAKNNPVNSTDYPVMTNSIMNIPYGVSDWDKHSINIINVNKNKLAPNISYITSAFPSGFEFLVSESTGKPQASAEINLFPVGWIGNAVDPVPIFTGHTDAAGRLTLPSNPFDPAQPGNPWDIRYCNFLIQASRGTAKTFHWLPLDEVQNFSFSNPGKVFVIPMIL